MRPVVVTEGAIDAAFIGRAIKGALPAGQSPEILAAGGWSAAESLARSILLTRRAPTALVVDAEETDPARVAERQEFMESSLQAYSGSTPFRVIQIAPTVLSILFRQPRYLQGVVLTRRQRIRAQYEPSKILVEILKHSPRSMSEIEKRLEPRWGGIREEPELAALLTFLDLERQQAAVLAAHLADLDKQRRLKLITFRQWGVELARIADLNNETADTDHYISETMVGALETSAGATGTGQDLQALTSKILRQLQARINASQGS